VVIASGSKDDACCRPMAWRLKVVADVAAVETSAV
jgi:hypothetical protein